MDATDNYWSEEKEFPHKPLYFDECLFDYRLFFTKVLEVLSIVFDNKSEFIVPSQNLNFLYSNLLDAIQKIESRSDFEYLRLISFKDYPSLTFNTDFMIDNWTEFKNQLNLHLNTIEHEYLIKCIGDFKVNEQLISFFEEIDNELSKLKSQKIRDIVLDPKTSSLQFGDNKTISISITAQEVKLLQLLIENKSKVVEYKDIAKVLEMNSYHQGIDNKSVARGVQFVKRNLVHLLRKSGMFNSEISKRLKFKTNVGYILT